MNHNIPTISVVLPVYNGAKFISEAVDSILTQTFKNFELIIIDDGSTDETAEILKRYADLDHRVRSITRKNKGLVATLNEGIDLARGEWIARMDADDISLPHRFERQLDFLEKTKADICGSWIKYFGGGDRRVWKTYQSDSAIKLDMIFKSPLAHPTVFFRAHFLKKMRYGVDMDYAEDYDLWSRAAMSGLKIVNIPEVLLHYRRHAGQISTATYRKQQLFGKRVKNNYCDFLSQQLDLNPDLLRGLLLQDSSAYCLDSLDFELAIGKLFVGATYEDKSAISQGISRVCYSLAADHWSIVIRLSKCISSLGIRFSMIIWCRLFIINLFRLRVEGSFFIIALRLNSLLFKGGRI